MHTSAITVRGRKAALSFAVLSGLWAGSFTHSVEGAGYRFLLPTIDAKAGDTVRITVRGEYEESAQGFSFAARFPAADLTIEDVHATDTILEAINTDFFEAKILPSQGILIVGALVDSEPPFDGNLIPNIGMPLELFHIDAKVSSGASGDLRIRMENGLGDPEIDNLYSVDNKAKPVTELGEGVIRLPGAGGGGAMFSRGDFNFDSDIDISDPIAILQYVFFGGAAPRCILAADANDDEKVDISDPIFILIYLFNEGREPPPPSMEGGPDPTPGSLDCAHPLERP